MPWFEYLLNIANLATKIALIKRQQQNCQTKELRSIYSSLCSSSVAYTLDELSSFNYFLDEFTNI